MRLSNLSSKVGLYFLSICLLTVFSISCKKKSTEGPLQQAENPYVFSHTSGVLSRGSTVQVTLIDPAIDKNLIGTDASAILSLDPSVKGKAIWLDERTISFKSDDLLPVNSRFRVEVDMAAIKKDAPSEFQDFWFDIQTRPAYLDYRFDRLQSIAGDPNGKQEFSAQIISSDIIPSAELEAAIAFQQNGNVVKLKWMHEPGGTIHRLVAELPRGADASTIKIDIDSKSVGGKDSKTESMTIPGTGVFEVVFARAENEPESFAQFNFSEPLDATQEFEGLVSIDDWKGSLRYLVDGNLLRVYPGERQVGKRTFHLSENIKTNTGKTLGKEGIWKLEFVDIKPQVEMLGKGVILPSTSGLIFPFRAINLHAVDIEIVKIYSNNMVQFLQENELDGGSSLNRVGRIVFQQKLVLQELNPKALPKEWNRYALDLSDFIKTDPEAMYQVRIGFRPDYTDYTCSVQAPDYVNEFPMGVKDDAGNYLSFYDGNYEGMAGYYDGYEWEHQSDPCFPEYYQRGRFVSRNVFASNLGILAKAGTDGSYFVVTTDLRTAQPWSGVNLTFMDYQNQKVGEATTDGQGFAKVSKLSGVPFLIIANIQKEKGYLKIFEGSSLSMSRFDISGLAPQKGLKGFVYGERGVWRPGDSIYMHLIMENRQGEIPKDLPVSYEFKNPKGQILQRGIVINPVGTIYPIRLYTSDEALTGNWSLELKAGGAFFQKTVQIEAIKPNRLKIKLDLPKRINVNNAKTAIPLSANWLTGSVAAGLRAETELLLSPIPTTFTSYPKYAFDDPARDITPEPILLFDQDLDAEGKGSFLIPLLSDKQVSGRLLATLKTRVFEAGGDASIDQTTVEIDPYRQFAGISMPKDENDQNRLELGKTGTLAVVVVDVNGKPIKNQKVSVGLYRSEWRWWWDNSYDYVSRFNSSDHQEAIDRIDLVTNDVGEAKWNLKITQWGRYMVRACTETGHCSGDFFYVGYPWDGESDQAYEESNMLTLKGDKEKYVVGEQIKISVPSAENSRLLVTIENGVGVIESFWQDGTKGNTLLNLKVKPEWAPSAYVHITLLQAHSQTNNDLPIRMYGVVPIMVENPAAKLSPIIQTKAEFKPETEETIQVSESGGKAMAYNIAVVDEGLLDITRFKTPDPYGAFNAKEALGVHTWDLFDQVMGGYGGAIEKLFAIGGDGAANKIQGTPKANRFPPMVRVIGPFQLDAGKTNSHKIKIPNYIGSVRIMVVAAAAHQFGSSEKTIAVKKDLMTLATLPRVLTPGDQIAFPVTVFANAAKIKSAVIQVAELGGMVKWTEGTEKTVTFNGPSEQLVQFPGQILSKTGVAKFVITSTANGEKSKQQIEIQVRNPNPYEINEKELELKGKMTESITVTAPGVPGTNSSYLEVSSIPAIDLTRHLSYLLEYPYGCLEQTVSGALPQLYLSQFSKLDSFQMKLANYQVREALYKVKMFANANGGFNYWPGSHDANSWGTSYVGHFMLLAQQKGYSIDQDILKGWKNYQGMMAKKWVPVMKDFYYYSGVEQAYRLYTLALAGSPEMGAMNQLKELKGLDIQSQWRLAAAYALAGRPEIATRMTQNLNTNINPYRSMDDSYGSDLRDNAMILETMVLIKDKR
ncbi:MAG: MG2 domain-containing protein, partial [Saprospiraceae bacterium]